MAADLKSHFEGIDIELVEGGGGIFDVMSGGKLIYSKKETGRHANPGEVASLLEDAQ